MTVTNIPQRFVVVQDNAPASPFEGQIWVDTSSGNTTKQYKNGSFETVSTSLDPVYNILSEMAGFLEAVDLNTSLNDYNHDDGFVDLHQDKTGISSSNNVSITTGKPSGNVKSLEKGKVDDVESGSSELDWESKTDVSIDSNNEVNGTYSVEVTSSNDFVLFAESLKSKISENFTFEISMKIENVIGSGDDRVRIALNDSGGSTIGDLEFRDNGNDIFFRTVNIGSWSYGSVIDIEISVDFSNQSVDIFKNGSKIGNSLGFEDPVTEITEILFDHRTGSSGITRNFWFDSYTYSFGPVDGVVTYTTRTLDIVPNEIQVDSSEVNLPGSSTIEVDISDQSGNKVTVTSFDSSVDATALQDFELDTTVRLLPDSNGNLPDYNKLIWTGVQ